MITDLFFGGFLEVLRAMLGSLPTFELDFSELGDGVAVIADAASWMNGYFPIATLALVLAVVWGWRGVLILYSAAREMWDALPFT